MPEIIYFKLDRIFFRQLIDGVKDFQALSKAQSDWRLAHGNAIKRKDLFASLVEAKDTDTGDGLTEEQVVAETGSLLLAGLDTQATTLATTIFYLSRNNFVASTRDLYHFQGCRRYPMDWRLGRKSLGRTSKPCLPSAHSNLRNLTFMRKFCILKF